MSSAEETEPGAAETAPTPAAGSTAPVARDLTIRNKRGLHARAAAHFVRCAEQFDAEVTVSRDATTVGGTSIMGLMMLAAGTGSVIRVAATGAQAEAAVSALAALVDSLFGEEE